MLSKAKCTHIWASCTVDFDCYHHFDTHVGLSVAGPLLYCSTFIFSDHEFCPGDLGSFSFAFILTHFCTCIPVSYLIYNN